MHPLSPSCFKLYLSLSQDHLSCFMLHIPIVVINNIMDLSTYLYMPKPQTLPPCFLFQMTSLCGTVSIVVMRCILHCFLFVHMCVHARALLCVCKWERQSISLGRSFAGDSIDVGGTNHPLIHFFFPTSFTTLAFRIGWGGGGPEETHHHDRGSLKVSLSPPHTLLLTYPLVTLTLSFTWRCEGVIKLRIQHYFWSCKYQLWLAFFFF